MVGSEKANQKSAVADQESCPPRVEFAALVDEADDRVREDEEHHRRRDQRRRGSARIPLRQRRPQVVRIRLLLAKRARVGKSDGRDGHREDPLRQLVDPEGLVDRGRRFGRDERCRTRLLISSVEVDQAEADRHRQHQQQDPPHARVAPVEAPGEAGTGVLRRSQAGIAQPHRGADAGWRSRRRRSGLCSQNLGSRDDEHEDDRQVPEERRDREGPEAVVAVEDRRRRCRSPRAGSGSGRGRGESDDR